MLKALSVAALLSVGASTTCPSNVKVLDTLDLHKYPGVWYEVASQNLAFLSGCSCSRYGYKMTGAQTFDDHFSCTSKGKASAISLILKGQIPDLTKPAVQKESPLFSFLPTAPYLVLEVGKDYEYAVVYACVQLPFGKTVQTTYIFHRNSQALTKSLIDLDGIKTRLTAQGIDVSLIIPVPQPADCVYPSETDPVQIRTGSGQVMAMNATLQAQKETAQGSYKCIDKWKRCTDQWCNDNCNHNPRFCPPSYCRGAATPTPAPAPPAPKPDPLEKCPGDTILGTSFFDEKNENVHKAYKLVCCPASCGDCAGKDCATRPGGAKNCCGRTIVGKSPQAKCGSAPCVLGDPPPPEAAVVNVVV